MMFQFKKKQTILVRVMVLMTDLLDADTISRSVDSALFNKRCQFRGLLSHTCLFNLRSSATAMEIVTHLINDTIEFYKWTLTIAGNTLVFFCVV